MEHVYYILTSWSARRCPWNLKKKVTPGYPWVSSKKFLSIWFFVIWPTMANIYERKAFLHEFRPKRNMKICWIWVIARHAWHCAFTLALTNHFLLTYIVHLIVRIRIYKIIMFLLNCFCHMLNYDIIKCRFIIYKW